MNYSKTYLSIVIFSFFLALWMIGSAKSLETTWLGIYNRAGNIQKESANEYSSTFFSKKRCEKWIRDNKKYWPEGAYACGKNCTFERGGFLSCEKLYDY